MARQIITAKGLDAIIAEAKAARERKELPIGQSRGLYLFILPSGTCSWYFRYKNAAGKQCRVPLGFYPDLSLADATDKADAERTRTRAGADPAAERVEQREQERAKADHAKAEAVRREAGETLRPQDPFGMWWARFDSDYLAKRVKPGTASKWRGIHGRVFDGGGRRP